MLPTSQDPNQQSGLEQINEAQSINKIQEKFLNLIDLYDPIKDNTNRFRKQLYRLNHPHHKQVGNELPHTDNKLFLS